MLRVLGFRVEGSGRDVVKNADFCDKCLRLQARVQSFPGVGLRIGIYLIHRLGLS